MGAAFRGALLAAPALLLATPGVAQDAQQRDTQQADMRQTAGLEEIVVTAQKRAENVQDVPIAISAIGAAYLQARDINAIDELGQISPGLKISRAPSSRTITQIAMRGSVTINPAITWEPAVGLYLDGVYIAKAQGSVFDIADLERVEVLRGPQGTLYGRNTLAGAINLVTKKPSGEFGGSLEAGYGTYNHWRAKGTVDLPRMGIFSAKLSGQVQHRDGFVKVVPDAILPHPPVKDADNLSNKSFMVQVRAEPSDKLTVDYTYDFSQYNEQTDFPQLVYLNRNGEPGDIFDPHSPGYAGIPLYLYQHAGRQKEGTLDTNIFEKVKTQGHALTLALDLGSAELKSITAYRKLHYHDRIDLDGSPFAIAAAERNSKYHSVSEELQLTGKAFADRLDYVVGLYWFKDKAVTFGPQSYFFGATTFQSDLGSHTEAWAAYAQLDYHLTEQLTLTGGLRYTHEKKDVARKLVLGPGTPAEITLMDVLYGEVPDAKYNDVSPAATLRYQLTDNVNVYARYAKGFKSGGFNGETSEIGIPTAGCPSGAFELCTPYKPETVNSYEVGLKSRLLANTLQLNIAAFWDEHKDMQVSVFRGTGAASTVVQNAAAARIRGVEVEWVAQPVDGFTFNGSFSWLDTKYKHFIDGGVDVADNRAFPHAPRYTASLGADWRAAQGDWGRLNFLADMNFTSRYYTFPFAINVPDPSDQTAKTTQSQGQTIVNLRATVSEVPLGAVKANISLWAKNIFQEKEPLNFLDFGPSFGGMTTAFFPDPRTFGATVGVRF